MNPNNRLQAVLLAVMAALSLGAATAVFPASAAGLNLNVSKIGVDVDDAAPCDSSVIVTPTQVPVDGVIVSVDVSGIDLGACSGWILKLRVINSAGTPVGAELTTVVNQTTESFTSNIDPGGSFTVRHVFQP